MAAPLRASTIQSRARILPVEPHPFRGIEEDGARRYVSGISVDVRVRWRVAVSIRIWQSGSQQRKVLRFGSKKVTLQYRGIPK